ncbi:helix-turn-helix domain-containing protein, partial [Paenibacillus sp. LHD-38]
MQRWRRQGARDDQRLHAKRQAPANKLSVLEQRKIIEVINQPEFKSLPPSQIVPRLADLGIYLASESTFYRVMHQYKQQHYRGRSK